jgi:hypothetical protein
VAGTLLVLMRELGTRFLDSISILVLPHLTYIRASKPVIDWSDFFGIYWYLAPYLSSFFMSCFGVKYLLSLGWNENGWSGMFQVSSDVPEGKGVSSSAAIEVATMSAIAAAYGKLLGWLHRHCNSTMFWQYSLTDYLLEHHFNN